MLDTFHKSSLREPLVEDLKEFLKNEGFKPTEIYSKGLLHIINLVSDYYEEGRHLYPEVVITHDLNSLEFLLARKILIKKSAIAIESFKQALKLCAPLAIDGWVIYLELKDDAMNFGVFSTEASEISLSLSRQTMNEDSLLEESTFIHIRCIGQKVVELRGRRGKLHIYLNLDEEMDISDNKIERLSESITSGCGENKEMLCTYFEKIIDNSLKAGHGNLIGVVKDNAKAIDDIKTKLADGIYLETPIDIPNLFKEAEEQKSVTTTTSLKAYISLVSAMMNHDGITLITNTGKILGYHLFIKSNQEDSKLVGGARSRAFESMKKLGLEACFYKSQDGNIKIE